MYFEFSSDANKCICAILDFIIAMPFDMSNSTLISRLTLFCYSKWNASLGSKVNIVHVDGSNHSAYFVRNLLKHFVLKRMGKMPEICFKSAYKNKNAVRKQRNTLNGRDVCGYITYGIISRFLLVN